MRQPNGRYMARLPFKHYFDLSATLGHSKQMALNQFHSLERRFQRNPKLYEEYSAIINEYIELGEMIPYDKSENECKIINGKDASYTSCYLPHHPVITTKVRIVVNASAKTSNGKSLLRLHYKIVYLAFVTLLSFDHM